MHEVGPVIMIRIGLNLIRHTSIYNFPPTGAGLKFFSISLQEIRALSSSSNCMEEKKREKKGERKRRFLERRSYKLIKILERILLYFASIKQIKAAVE